MSEVSDVLDFLFGRPMLKTDMICPKCKGYISLKVDTMDKGGWVTKKCLCGTTIKYLTSNKEVYIDKKSYDPIYTAWKKKGCK